MQTIEILNYIIEIKRKFQNKIDKSELTESEKEYCLHQIEAFNNIENWIIWKLKTPEERQVQRIRSLATMRKIDALPHILEKQKKIIFLFDIYKTTINYIRAMNTTVLDELIEFCEKQIEKIDFSYEGNIIIFPSNTEIENAFKSYFEVIKPAKGNGNMFEECYEKIEYLFNELKKMEEVNRK